MTTSGECEWLTGEIGKGKVGCETQLTGESFEANMMRAMDYGGDIFGPPHPWFTDHRNARCAFDWFNNSNQFGRPEWSSILQKSWREINHTERSCRRLKYGFENVGVGQVSLCAHFSIRGTNAEASAILDIQKRRTHWFGIESWETAPDDLPFVVHECGKLAIPD
jgi:hypothetical protein